jgi:hypothetical protein
MSENKQGEIANRLIETSAAHNEYEQRELNGVYDQLWPGWYAAYLVQHGIGDLLGLTLTSEKLSQLLAQFDTDYRSQVRQESWPDYYAVQLLKWGAASRQ